MMRPVRFSEFPESKQRVRSYQGVCWCLMDGEAQRCIPGLTFSYRGWHVDTTWLSLPFAFRAHFHAYFEKVKKMRGEVGSCR